MFKVKFTATVFNPDTEETFNGWVDPNWAIMELRSEPTDVATFSFDTFDEAIEFIDKTIGSTTDNGDGTFYAEDARTNLESGEDWSYAAHITE